MYFRVKCGFFDEVRIEAEVWEFTGKGSVYMQTIAAVVRLQEYG